MARCGWCKRNTLVVNRSSTGKRGDDTLEEHYLPGTVKTVCRGPESYREMDDTGRLTRSKY